jgi:arsenite methyltransferase
VKYLEEIDCTTPEFGDFYDELPLWSAPFGRMLLEHVVLRRGITILDVGAGTGFLSVELAQRCGSDAEVIAVDPWPAAVSRLNRKLSHRGIPNVRTVLGDVVAIDLADSSVDLIVSNLGINNFEQPEAALRSCFRVAKPGADLFLTTNLVGHMGEFYEVYRSVLAELGLHDRIAPLDAHIRHRATVDSLRSLLEGAGFEFVDAIASSFQERFVDGSALLAHRFVRLGFLPGWKSIAPQDAVEATFAALERRLNAAAAERGELSLTIPAVCVHARKPVAGQKEPIQEPAS